MQGVFNSNILIYIYTIRQIPPRVCTLVLFIIVATDSHVNTHTVFVVSMCDLISFSVDTDANGVECIVCVCVWGEYALHCVWV